jgi:hypothetical protein
MDTGIERSHYEPDPAAVFAAAFSLWEACQACANRDAGLNLSECYNGMDQFMREVMRVGNFFESWSCGHVDFDQPPDVWPICCRTGSETVV